MSTISFFIKGSPVGQPRVTHGYRPGHAFIPDSHPVHTWKQAIFLQCKAHKPNPPLEGPLRVNLFFFFERPLRHYGSRKGVSYLKPLSPEWHTVKPDRDNLDKAVLDVLTRAGFWTDDCQVCSGMIEKKYRPLRAEPIEADYLFLPGVSVIIEQL